MSQANVESMPGVRTSVPVSGQYGPRSLDELILVRFPPLAQLLVSLWSRLPPRSRLRKVWLKRRSRRGCAAANRRDFEVLLLALDPQIEYESSITDTGGSLFPDVLGRQSGHDAYRAVWQALDDAWEDVKLEHHEVIDFGDQIIAHARLHGRGRHTGIPIDQPIFQVFTMERGLVVRQHDFAERDKALEAVGLRE